MPPSKLKKVEESRSDEDSDIPGSDWGSSDEEDSTDDEDDNDNASGVDDDDDDDVVDTVKSKVLLIDGKQMKVEHVYPGKGYFAVKLKKSDDVWWVKVSNEGKKGSKTKTFVQMTVDECRRAMKGVGAKMFAGDVPTAVEIATFKAAAGSVYPKQLTVVKKPGEQVKFIKVDKLSGPTIATKNMPENVRVIMNNGKHYWLTENAGSYKLMQVTEIRDMLKAEGMGVITKDKAGKVDAECLERYGVKCAAQVHTANDRQIAARKKKDGKQMKTEVRAAVVRTEKRELQLDATKGEISSKKMKVDKRDCASSVVVPQQLKESAVTETRSSLQTAGEVTFTWKGSAAEFLVSPLASM